MFQRTVVYVDLRLGLEADGGHVFLVEVAGNPFGGTCVSDGGEVV
jgi:hypothetical protein